MQQQSGDPYAFDNLGKFFRNNELFGNILHVIQITFYHDDFGVSKLLGNKVKKHRILVFRRNIPAKYGSRLKDIQLALLYPSA